MHASDHAHGFRPSAVAAARIAALRERLARGEGLRAAVVGAGKSGLAALDLLVARGCEVRVLDDAPLDAGALAARGAAGTGPVDAAALEAAELVVLSPGVPRSRPELSPVIARGALVGEIELASWFVRAPMIGITGTNGKSTTTALTAHLCAAAGLRVFAGGNLGEPLSRLALSAAPVDVAVVEVSSYQLESLAEASFEVACWLNLTPDHLDRYSGVDAYAAAKRRLVERCRAGGVAVLNASDPRCVEAGQGAPGAVRWFAVDPGEPAARAAGAVLEGPSVAVRREGGREERYRIEAASLLGRHNKANALAAIECARHLGLDPAALEAGLATFRGLPHRLEHVGARGGVDWYNDSKATNVDSAVTALEAMDRPVVLIAGGKDKAAPWAPLVERARGKVRRVLAIGEATPLVLAAFEGQVPAVEAVGTLAAAVARAAAEAAPGDAVLLSPACASYDQFRNYEHRGEVFRALVSALGEGER